MDDFINPVLTNQSIDTFVIRKSIFEALKNKLPFFTGNLLDIGCGKMPYKEYILKNSVVNKYEGIDIEDALVYDNNIKPDFYWDGKTLPLANKTYDVIIATEVLEHVPDIKHFLNEVNRVLKKGGVFFLTTPFLWNLHEIPHDHHRLTPFSLERHLKENNFHKIEITAAGTWHTSMAQMLGLWVKRSPLPYSVRKILTPLIKGIMKFLLKKDYPTSTFDTNLMLNSLSSIAFKK